MGSFVRGSEGGEGAAEALAEVGELGVADDERGREADARLVGRVDDEAVVERGVRGSTAGFNTPLAIVDLPGGGGKRDVHSFEHYDRTTGISVYRSPAVHADLVYLYFDPIDLLPKEGQERWSRPAEHQKMVDEAIAAAGLIGMPLAVA